MITRRWLLCSKKRSKEFLSKLWRKSCYYRSGSSGIPLESQCLIPDAFIYKKDKKINSYLEGIPTFEKSLVSIVSSECKITEEVLERTSQKQRNQKVMDSTKALFETSDQDDNRDESDSQCAEQISAAKKVFSEKPRPNYFVAVRVSNPAIHKSVKLIQDSVVNFYKLLQPALIPISSLHITLMVMHLQAEEVEKAVEVLKSCESDFRDLFDDTLSMTFNDLAHFRNEVLFGKMNNEEELEKLKLLATVVRNNYEKNGFSSTDDRPFTPHLTIMKLSRMQYKRKKKVKKIPPESYSSWLDCELGKETVSEVLLCSMIHEADEEGFYHCVGSASISNGM